MNKIEDIREIDKLLDTYALLIPIQPEIGNLDNSTPLKKLNQKSKIFP